MAKNNIPRHVGFIPDGNLLDPAFFTFLVQQQPRVDTMSVAGSFGKTMIHGPASISVGNETDVTRDIIFCHCKPYSNIMWGHS